MAKPTLVVVTDDPGTLTAATQALERRFGADYQVVAADAPAAALTALGQAGEQVALLLARPVARGHDRDRVPVPRP